MVKLAVLSLAIGLVLMLLSGAINNDRRSIVVLIVGAMFGLLSVGLYAQGQTTSPPAYKRADREILSVNKRVAFAHELFITSLVKMP